MDGPTAKKRNVAVDLNVSLWLFTTSPSFLILNWNVAAFHSSFDVQLLDS